MHVKKGDKVVIRTGKDRGKTGLVIKSMPKENRVVVEGVHIAKVHEKSKKGRGKGTIVEKPMPIHASNVQKVEGRAKKTKTK